MGRGRDDSNDSRGRRRRYSTRSPSSSSCSSSYSSSSYSSDSTVSRRRPRGERDYSRERRDGTRKPRDDERPRDDVRRPRDYGRDYGKGRDAGRERDYGRDRRDDRDKDRGGDRDRGNSNRDGDRRDRNRDFRGGDRRDDRGRRDYGKGYGYGYGRDNKDPRAPPPPSETLEERETKRKEMRKAYEGLWARSPSPPMEFRMVQKDLARHIEDAERQKRKEEDGESSSSEKKKKKKDKKKKKKDKKKKKKDKRKKKKDKKRRRVSSSSGGSESVAESGDEMGPMPIDAGVAAVKNYGEGMLRGEGESMAAFVQDNKRIPRRGEIGYDTEIIESFEKQGFVMSGSRHKAMNAMRIKKEAQVISAEEKRKMAISAREERVNKGNKVLQTFRDAIEKMSEDAKLND